MSDVNEEESLKNKDSTHLYTSRFLLVEVDVVLQSNVLRMALRCW